ncbi:MAG: hypothetical protein ACP5E4_00585 [Candidatus Aenigmatarchaeota archaeon]
MDGAVGYLASALSQLGIEYTHYAPEKLEYLQADPKKLSGYDAIILSDAPSRLLGEGVMEAIRDVVKEDGVGLCMIGG